MLWNIWIKLERNIIWSLAIILIVLGLFSCAKPKIDADKKDPTVLETISNMNGIVDVLGCTFAPDDPSCKNYIQDNLNL